MYMFFFRFFSIVGYYKILNIVPCAIQLVLVVYFIVVCICYSQACNLSISLLGNTKFSVFVNLFLFCKYVHLYHILDSPCE